MRRSDEGDVQIGEVNDSEEDGRREEEPQAERLFANLGGTIPDQGSGSGSGGSVVYHLINAAQLAAEGQVEEQGTNPVYQFQTPNLQMLEPIPPDQLRNVSFVTNQTFMPAEKEKAAAESREGDSEEEEKGEKEKRSEEKDKEKKRWEERSRRMEKQLQEQRLQCGRQKPQAESKNAASKRPHNWGNPQVQDPDSEEEERPFSYSKQLNGRSSSSLSGS